MLCTGTVSGSQYLKVHWVYPIPNIFPLDILSPYHPPMRPSNSNKCSVTRTAIIHGSSSGSTSSSSSLRLLKPFWTLIVELFWRFHESRLYTARLFVCLFACLFVCLFVCLFLMCLPRELLIELTPRCSCAWWARWASNYTNLGKMGQRESVAHLVNPNWHGKTNQLERYENVVRCEYVNISRNAPNLLTTHLELFLVTGADGIDLNVREEALNCQIPCSQLSFRV